MSEETKRRAKETRRRIKEDEPARYRASSERRSAALKKSYMAGNRDGIVNGMTGKTHGEEVRLQMSKKKKELWQKILSDPDKHAEYVKRATIVNRKTWESQELRDKCKIIRSKAYLQYGVHPQEFYKQKLRPLLQLGFLPTAIVRYRLLDMHAGSIKLWIKRYGSEEDMTQFEENKKKGAGANKAYIKFQEDQYKKHFFCGPPRPNDL